MKQLVTRICLLYLTYTYIGLFTFIILTTTDFHFRHSRITHLNAKHCALKCETCPPLINHLNDKVFDKLYFNCWPCIENSKLSFSTSVQLNLVQTDPMRSFGVVNSQFNQSSSCATPLILVEVKNLNSQITQIKISRICQKFRVLLQFVILCPV